MATGMKRKKHIKKRSIIPLGVLTGALLLFGYGSFSAVFGQNFEVVQEKMAIVPQQTVVQKTTTGSAIKVMRSSKGIKVLLDPYSSVWSQTPMARIPLFRQTIVTPNGGGSVSELFVKAVHNDTGLAIRLEWKDGTKDNETVHQVKFRDGVAVQFPTPGTTDTVLSMGCPHGPVNIWHWKADWEPEAPKMNTSPYDNPNGPINNNPSVLYRRLHVDSSTEPNAAQGKGGPVTGVFNMFPQNAHKSSVEDIVAIGVSSITTKPSKLQTLKGRGIWKDGKWNVVIYKPLEDNKDPTSPVFREGKSINTSFAVWNGSQKDRNGMKSVSNWTSMLFR